MAARTIITTPIKELALATVVSLRNAEIDATNVTRAAQTPPLEPLPHVTADSYFQDRTDDVLQSYADVHSERMMAGALAKLPSLPVETQAEVLAAVDLGYISALPSEKQAEVLGAVALAKFMALSVDQRNTLVTLVYPLAKHLGETK